MMIAQINLQKGDEVPRHSHENEQLTYVLRGRSGYGWASTMSAKSLSVPAKS